MENAHARMAAARAATLPARGPDDHDLAVPWTPHVQHVLTLLSMILLVLSVLLIPMQLHFFIDMPILNLSMQRLPEAVIIVFLTIYSSDTNHLTVMLEIPTAQGPDAPRAAAHRSLHTTHTRIDSHAAHTPAPAPPAPAPPHPLHVRAQHDLPQHPQRALPQRARRPARRPAAPPQARPPTWDPTIRPVARFEGRAAEGYQSRSVSPKAWWICLRSVSRA